MNRLPDRPNLDHLKKQAKDLMRRYRDRSPEAIAQLRLVLPAAAGRTDDEIAALGLRLHDAQSCVARGYGFVSWSDLKQYVEAQSGSRDDRASLMRRWLAFVYAGDVDGRGIDRANPRVAARMLAENPDLPAGSPYLACAVGDEASLRAATKADPAWVDRPGGPLRLPPIVAVTHSSLLQVPEFRERLHRSVRFLLSAGADPNQRIGLRWPPASVSAPDENQPLSALFGAAGKNHDVELTKILLDAGADPNDGELLYHSLEGGGACTRVLLESGARVAGTNALYRALDFDILAALELLLQHGADPNEAPANPPLSDWGAPLLWAIKRRRSRRHVEMLLRAGADPSARTASGVSAYSLALQLGLGEVAELLRDSAGAEPISEDERFIAACARGDETEARRIRSLRPDLPASPAASAFAVAAGPDGRGRRRRGQADGETRLADRGTGRRLECLRAQSGGFSRQCRVGALPSGARRQLEGGARLRRQCLWHVVMGIV